IQRQAAAETKPGYRGVRARYGMWGLRKISATYLEIVIIPFTLVTNTAKSFTLVLMRSGAYATAAPDAATRTIMQTIMRLLGENFARIWVIGCHLRSTPILR